MGDESAGVLPSAGVAQAVAVRARDRDHAPASRWRARSADDAHEHERRADAGGDRVSPVLSTDRFDAGRMDAVDGCANTLAALAGQDPDRRDRTDREHP